MTSSSGENPRTSRNGGAVVVFLVGGIRYLGYLGSSGRIFLELLILLAEMSTQWSSKSSRIIKTLPQDGYSSGRRVNDLTVPKNSRPGNPRSLPQRTRKKEHYGSDYEGDESENDTDDTKFRSRGRRVNSHGTNGKTTIHLYSEESDPGNHLDRDRGRRPRKSSSAPANSKRDGWASLIPDRDYGPNGVFKNHVEELAYVKRAKEAIPPDHGRRARSTSRKDAERGRSTNSHRTTGAKPVSSEEEYFTADSERLSDARKSAKIKKPDKYTKEQVAQFDTYDDSERRSDIKRKPVGAAGVALKGVNPKGRVEAPQLNHHGNGSLNNPRNLPPKTPQPPPRPRQKKVTWGSIGGPEWRDARDPSGNASSELLIETAEHYNGGLGEFMGGPKQGRNKHREQSKNTESKKPEQYLAKRDPFAGFDAPPEKERKKNKSPSGMLRKVFGSWGSAKPSDERRR
ncbi:hypothetical protein EAE96_009330 [Botrytis aclada]|nr:hypothetical protein EAE96_009330 [Botrytis aclada]